MKTVTSEQSPIDDHLARIIRDELGARMEASSVDDEVTEEALIGELVNGIFHLAKAVDQLSEM